MVRSRIARALRGLRGQPKAAIPGSALSLGQYGPDHKVRHLSLIDILRDLERPVLQWLAAHTTMITARRGRLIYTPGETREALFLLKSGNVRLYRLTADGKKLILSTLAPHTVFGDMPLAGQQMYGAYAEALSDCMICVLGRADLEKLIEARPLVAIRLLDIIGQRLVEAESGIEDVAFKGVPARLATVLVRLSGRDGADEVRGYSHQDLAEMIGSYRETVTATLDDFKGRALVTVGRRHIQILDRRGLERIAGI
jgi:CRP/FNR family transcriptional regulator, cyclic AMP receptor protein